MFIKAKNKDGSFSLQFPSVELSLTPFSWGTNNAALQKGLSLALSQAFSKSASNVHRSFLLRSGDDRSSDMLAMDSQLNMMLNDYDGIVAAISWLDDVLIEHANKDLFAVFIIDESQKRFFGIAVLDAITFQSIDTAICRKSDHPLMTSVNAWFSEWTDNCLNFDLLQIHRQTKLFTEDAGTYPFLKLTLRKGDVFLSFDSAERAASAYQDHKIKFSRDYVAMDVEMNAAQHNFMLTHYEESGQMERAAALRQIRTNSN